MARSKNNKQYKTSPQKLAKDKQWRLDNPGYHAKASKDWNAANKEHIKKYKEDKKENILYVIEIGLEYYYGSTEQGLNRRRNAHIADLRSGVGNPRMRIIFNELGEEEFKKLFKMTQLHSWDTIEETRKVEKYLLKKHVGKPGCMNANK